MAAAVVAVTRKLDARMSTHMHTREDNGGKRPVTIALFKIMFLFIWST